MFFIILNDSQELLEAVERERNVRVNQTRNTTIFHHPTLGDFELQHVGSCICLSYFLLMSLSQLKEKKPYNTIDWFKKFFL